MLVTLIVCALAGCGGSAAAGDGEGEASKAAAEAAPLLDQIEAAIEKRDKLEAASLLRELEARVPGDAKVGALREKADALAWPERTKIDLGSGVTMEFALIKPGEFVMGSPEGEVGRTYVETQHKVKLTKHYYMGVTELTQAQWKAVMGTAPSFFEGDTLPVERVSWNDAVAFCKKLSETTGATTRLPTEAEWEYACRGGTSGARYGPLDEVAWCGEKGRLTAHRVGGKKANAYGLHDMLGNVEEWCSDWYGPYAVNDTGVQDPTGAGTGRWRVLRRGAWWGDAHDCRAAFRASFEPSFYLLSIGFRVARAP